MKYESGLTNTQYWHERQVTLEDRLMKKSVKDVEEILKKSYKHLSTDLMDMLESEYEAIVGKNGNPKRNFDYNRYYKLMERINKRLKQMGLEETKILRTGMKDLYKRTCDVVDKCNHFDNLPGVSDKRINQVVDGVWVGDGENWSQRIWKNQAELSNKLSRGLLDALEGGIPLEELNKNLYNEVGVRYYQADRLTRTEFVHITNQATVDRYKDAGIESYRYVCNAGERTCPECQSKDGAIYNIDDTADLPPTHPNCRCTTIPVIAGVDLGYKPYQDVEEDKRPTRYGSKPIPDEDNPYLKKQILKHL